MLQNARRAARVRSMTTPDDLIRDRVAALVEDQADNGEPNPRQAAADYVENVLDNGWISSSDDTPVWELVEAMGFDRNDMDVFVVFALIDRLIHEI